MRGLPLSYSPEDLQIVYWGLGTHLGIAVSQNKDGELFGIVKNFGKMENTKRRGSKTADGLTFHSDRCDVVGLLCVAILPIRALTRAAAAFVTAFICCLTCSGGTLLNPAGTSNSESSTVVVMSFISATTFAPFTPCTLPLASVYSSALNGKPVSYIEKLKGVERVGDDTLNGRTADKYRFAG